MTPKKTLKKWFSNFMKPAQEHFAAWIDSYWHKSEKIPMSNIEGLNRAIENTASAGQLLNHINDSDAHSGLFNQKVDKEVGKGLSANDFTNEHKQKLENLQPTDTSAFLPKGGYEGTGQALKILIDQLEQKIAAIRETLTVDDAALDTLQEIITQVKANKNLEALLSGKVDKAGYFEKLKKLLDIAENDAVFMTSNKYIHIFGKKYMSIGTTETLALESDVGVYIRRKGGGSVHILQGDAQTITFRGDKQLDLYSNGNAALRGKETNITGDDVVRIHGQSIEISSNVLIGGQNISDEISNIKRRLDAIEMFLGNQGFTPYYP
ncbi:hypothetical protein [Capnocytophaga granulosa]|uniref:hypothetical protein n=1 Tax=Capnocytophaga granulosa TaxID=45242 RepID=UPI0023F4CD2A|nr:hypothetical protein [Capnocytophaga granulosa]